MGAAGRGGWEDARVPELSEPSELSQRSELHSRILHWSAGAARDLPWRRRGTSPWAVLVSEVMLQQTPVARVLPAYDAWLARWPNPAALAADSPGEAVRQWGRLGYPRRALRLHAAATVIARRPDGRVPSSYEELRELPGIGDYTAAAVASFGFGARHAVVDTNVSRVLARLVEGRPAPSSPATTRRSAEALLPDIRAPDWAAAVMELGALVCRARGPSCGHCPVPDRSAWQRAGRPAPDAPTRRPASPKSRYDGTDRQVRGQLLAVLRAAPASVEREALDAVPAPPAQRTRALASLLADGLVQRCSDGRYALPAG